MLSNYVEVSDFSIAFSTLYKELENFPFDSRDNPGTAFIMEESSCVAKSCGEKSNSFESEEVCLVGSSGSQMFLEAIAM